MADMITRCPKCSTAFHITDAHLRSANGSVRCGSCLTVFNGAENLTTQANSTKKKVEEEELLISDDMDLSEFEDELEEAPQPKKDTKKVERRKRPRTPEEDLVEDDESWALKLLEEEGHDPEHIGLVAKPKEDIDEEEEDFQSSNSELREEIKEEVEPEAEPSISDISDDTSEIVEPEPEASTPESEPIPAESTEAASKNNELLTSFEPESLELEIRKERSFWSSRILWLFLVLIGTGALGAQVAWLQFDILSRDPLYRPAYAIACEHIGCKLPALKDRTLIKASNLSIRSHPQTPNALMVDVILQNNAEFEQTFPSIVLTFSDLSSEVVAKRKFVPQDYLGGELAGVDKMPRKQPIHISLEIVDPGKGAESYDVLITD